jgi:hypothetical protein
MSKLKLSDEQRRRLWPCYALLLRLGKESKNNTAADSKLVEGHESAAATAANELTRPDHDTQEGWPRQMEAEQQTEQKA